MNANINTSSPRLYVSPDTMENLANHLHTPYLQDLSKRVVRRANTLVKTPAIREGECRTYQVGTRTICHYAEVLTAAWVLTKKQKYRDAAMRHMGTISNWNQISCEANSLSPTDKILPFCLSYGELCTVAGLMYDLFRSDMTDKERKQFDAIWDTFLLRAAMNCLEKPHWWVNKSWSNWNGVCAGGMGIMALAIAHDRPEAQKLIPFVETSLGEYFKSYVENGGGCHEGTGYWNYGMNYAMRYVLSWENATGNQHAALDIPEIGQSLNFPLDFTGISFGDNDGWHPTAFYFLLAKRLGLTSEAMHAAVYLTHDPKKFPKKHKLAVDILYAASAIPTQESIDKLRAVHAKKKSPVARVYQGMDWGALSDDEAFPALRMAVRGGSSKISGHGMLDLLSFRCRVHDELMITDQQDGSYMPSTFSKRGTELYGRSAASKSTLFVDGLGCHGAATCDRTEVVNSTHWLGIRIDGSHIYLPRWKEVFIGRLILLVDKSYWLVIDRLQGKNVEDKHWIESRFHTTAESSAGRNHVRLISGKQRMQMTFATLQDSTLLQATGTPSQPHIQPTQIYRLMSKAPSADQLHVTALMPGSRKAKLAIARTKTDGFQITVTDPSGKNRRIKLTSDLQPA